VRVPALRQPRARRASELEPFLRRLAQLVVAIFALVALGTVGFALTEDVSIWDGFTWTLDTVATVGSVPAPRDTGGQLVKDLLIVLGVGTLFYALVTVTEFFVEGHLGGLLAERRMRKMIDGLSDHYVICGFGRVGRQVARDLRVAGSRYVVVDSNPDSAAQAHHVGVRFIEGSPTEDDVLLAAGIERARAVLACVDSDADNIFITLTARELAPGVKIVARASSDDSAKKLKRAGADRVVSPYRSSGGEMARLALHPNVTGVVDVAGEYRLEEIEVTSGSSGAGKSLGEVRGGSIVAAVRRIDGTFEAQPPDDAVLRVGDVVIVIGTPRTLERLEALFTPGPTRAPA
jgi:voltage-gated potassium channel